MPATKEDTTFTLRLLDTEDALEYGATLAGESRSEFVRRAVRQRARRLERETMNEEEDERHG